VPGWVSLVAKQICKEKATLLCSPSYLPEVVNDSDVVLIEENKVNKDSAE